MGRINHRGWIVIHSISSDDGRCCVDFFKDPEGEFGFEHFRCDPEDQGFWTAVGGFSASRYPTLRSAADKSRATVAWLERDKRASAAFDSWISQLT